MKNTPTLKDLLEAGAHFGHQTKRWNPKMSKYIYTKRNGVHIIDLNQSQERLKLALEFISKISSEGKEILFVGTKRQAQEVVEDLAKSINVNYVTNRWAGGLLTNMNVTRKNINKMLSYRELIEKGVENRTKQEVLLMTKELERLERLYGGISGMKDLPGVVILADPHHERLAVKEANKLNIPIVAIVDTNCDPDVVEYIIPGNDDAIKSISLFFNLFADAIKDGREMKKINKNLKK